MTFRLKLGAENRAGLLRHGVVTTGEHINGCVTGFRLGVDGNVGFRQQGQARDPLGQELMGDQIQHCLLYTSPSPRDLSTSRMPSSA